MDNLVIEYLSNRLGKVVLNTNKRQGLGPVYLARMLGDGETGIVYEEDLAQLVSITTNIVLTKLANSPSNNKGEALLTNTAISIGAEIGNFTKCKIDKQQMLHIGDLFLEAFYHAGFLDIKIQDGFAPRSGSPYIIQIKEKFSDLIKQQTKRNLLLYTSLTKIPDITGVLQGENFEVIKGVNNENNKQPLILHKHVFEKDIETNKPWVQSVNKLQQQSWSINKEVLAVITSNLDNILPVKKSRLGKYNKADVHKAYQEMVSEPTEENKNKYNKVSAKWNKELVILRDISKRAELEAIYNKACALKDEDEFYQYIDLDYRSRVYYKEPFFNFQGADMARSLFLFKEGVKLSHKGIKWLYIHTASCYNESYDINNLPDWCSYDYKTYLKAEGLDSISVDKMTLQDRKLWVDNNLNFVLNSTDTIRHNCEKPFSFLAACVEIKNVLADPEYKSQLPIPIDGTCNGYQHSAAISKDELTGELVSLVQTDIQADLYVKAAKALINSMPEWFKDRPNMKMKHIRKYITKRATMTRAYSAGADKIADSMYADCYTGGISKKFNIEMTDCEVAAKEIIKALNEVCPGATKTMSFLQKLVDFEIGKTSAYDIDGSEWTHTKKKKAHSRKQTLKKIKEKTLDEELELELIEQQLTHVKNTRHLSYGNGKDHMSWITPSGFPVFYYNYLTREMNVYVTLSGVPVGHKKNGKYTGRITHVLQEASNFPSLKGLMSGISPNYTHSQDGSHMALIVSQWKHSFGAIHDSFSTHAEYVDNLSHLTRQVFIDIYDKENYFEFILNNVLSNTDNANLELPELGNLDITDVRSSEYFFC